MNMRRGKLMCRKISLDLIDSELRNPLCSSLFISIWFVANIDGFAIVMNEKHL